jgi:two-component system, OmpR family, aerobic respiration control sensor histidine kinase ArcB
MMSTQITLEELFEQLPVNIYWKNKDGVYLGCNTANWKAFGLPSLSDHIGKTDHEIFPKAEADQIRQFDEEVMRTGNPIIVQEDGETGVFLSHKAPLKNKDDQIIGLLGASINITHSQKEIS